MKSPEIKELVSSDELIKYNLEMVFYLYLDFYISYLFQIVIFLFTLNTYNDLIFMLLF